jgi:hypothetical protein
LASKLDGGAAACVTIAEKKALGSFLRSTADERSKQESAFQLRQEQEERAIVS